MLGGETTRRDDWIPPSSPPSLLMTMHMWVRGKRRKPRNCIRWISSRGRGVGGKLAAYGSVHRRLDHPEGRGGYGGPLKHSMFGNQVFNVSGSRDHHHGNRVQTICFIAQNTAIEIHLGRFKGVRQLSEKSVCLIISSVGALSITPHRDFPSLPSTYSSTVWHPSKGRHP